ncbi:MAG: hypothetical protein Q4F13_08150 [Pseudomonadota bacterium]|nr:hypothetical protein [Pseudomonadota bacterium]
MMLVAALGMLVPLYLLQAAIGRCEPYTIMVCMAAMPVFSFALGVALATAMLLWDVGVAQKRARSASAQRSQNLC